MPELTYVANTTGDHIIDEIDLGSVKAVSYTAQIMTESDMSLVQFKVVNDGVSIGKTQQGLGLSDDTPLSFVANIHLWEGRICANITSTPTTIVLERSNILANQFGEHTRSGRLIKHTEGFGYDISAGTYGNTITIRSDAENYFGNVAYVANGSVFMYAEPNLLVNETLESNVGWIPYNDAQVNNGIITTNNIYKDNFIYQRFDAQIGYVYRASKNSNSGTLIVSSTLEDARYIDADDNSEHTFVPDPGTEDLFYTIGHTSNSEIEVSNTVFQRILPVPTYNWEQGTIYLKWANVAPSTVLFDMETFFGELRTVAVAANGGVIISENGETLYLGPQAGGNNKLAISYSEGFVGSLNGNSVVSNLNIEILDNMYTLDFVTEPLQFSYVPTVLANSELIAFSNG